MFKTTPVAAAAMAIFATPLYAQTTVPAAPAAPTATQVAQATTGAAPGAPTGTADAKDAGASGATEGAAPGATLPAVKVTGQTDTSNDFQPDISSVGAK